MGNVSTDRSDGFLGVSLGNNFYSQRRLASYFAWAEVQLQQFAVLIGDWIFAYTHSFFHTAELRQSRRISDAMGDAARALCEKVSLVRGQPVTVLRWNDLRAEPHYHRLFTIFSGTFLENAAFRNDVLRQINFNLSPRLNQNGSIVNKDASIKHPLIQYLLHELAGLIVVSEYTPFHVEIYPGKDLFILENIYAGIYPDLRKALPEKPKREFAELILG